MKEGVGEYEIIEERLTHGRISEVQVEKLLKGVREGDFVITKSLTRLGRSLNMLIKVLRLLSERGASIVTVDDGRRYGPEDIKELLDHLQMAADLATAIKTERNAESAAKARERGHASGRPTGAKSAPEKTVLYGKTETLERLHAQGLTPGAIAQKLGVSRGTICNYLKTHR